MSRAEESAAGARRARLACGTSNYYCVIITHDITTCRLIGLFLPTAPQPLMAGSTTSIDIDSGSSFDSRKALSVVVMYYRFPNKNLEFLYNINSIQYPK